LAAVKLALVIQLAAKFMKADIRNSFSQFMVSQYCGYVPYQLKQVWAIIRVTGLTKPDTGSPLRHAKRDAIAAKKKRYRKSRSAILRQLATTKKPSLAQS
jgi:hypothetical protein